MSESHTTLPRRGLLAAAGLAGAAAVLRPGPAEATPTTGRSTGPAPEAKTRDGVPAGTTTLASAPLSGYSYTYLTMWDFTPENFGQGRAWTGAGGVYTPTGSGGALWATAQLPPGAVLGDVEWYLSASQDTQLLGRIWLAGTPALYLQAVDGMIAGGSAGEVRAQRIVATSTANGPYPTGSALALGVYTPNDKSVAVNGVRVGYKLAPAGEVLLSSPVRMYDSRSSSKISHGQTRSHNLASRLPVGALGAILNVTVTSTEKSGYLTVYASTASRPGASSINWSSSGQTIANGVESAVSSGRSIKVSAGGPSGSRTHYLVDLVGYIA